MIGYLWGTTSQTLGTTLIILTIIRIIGFQEIMRACGTGKDHLGATVSPH